MIASGVHSPIALSVIGGLSLYRAIDIIVKNIGVAVRGAYGRVDVGALPRRAVSRNTITALINYVELVFWYAAAYSVVKDGFGGWGTADRLSAFLASWAAQTTIVRWADRLPLQVGAGGCWRSTFGFWP